jgi:hypothetical protein
MWRNKAVTKAGIDGQNRYFLINDMLSGSFSVVRKTALDYHSGLDLMSKRSKRKIKISLLDLGKLNETQCVFAYVLRCKIR